MTVLTVFYFAFFCPYPWEWGGGGTQQIYMRGGSTRMSNPLPFLDTIFHKKATPFVYILVTNGTPFTYLI